MNNNTITVKASREKKITGSRIAAVLGRAEYKSEFRVWAELLGLYKENVDNVFVDFGNKFENKLLRFAEKKLGNLTRVNKEACQYDFYDNNDLLGGIPDGYTVGHNVVEAKLTNIKNRDKWEADEAALKQYLYQLYIYQMLHNHKFKVDVRKMFFVVGFYEDEEILQMKWRPSKKNVIIKELTLNIELTEMIMTNVKEWVAKHIDTGVSPEMVTEEDSKIANIIHEFIEVKTVEATEETLDLLRELSELEAKVKDDNKRVKKIKDSLKLVIAGKEKLIGTDEFNLKNSIFPKGYFNKKRFEKDFPGVYDRYVEDRIQSKMTYKKL